MESPSFSVIVPVYNSAEYLSECLDSVLGQKSKNFEVLCVNDGSTDSSLDILREYADRDSRIKIISSSQNRGLSYARNAALSEATGEYVCFVDSDDAVSTDLLAKSQDILASSNLDMLLFDAETFYEDEEMEAQFPAYKANYIRRISYGSSIPGSELFCKMKADGAYRMSACLYLVRREHIEANHLRFLEGYIYEDNLFTMQCLLLAKCVSHINSPFYRRRVRSGSLMTSSRTYFNCLSYFEIWIRMHFFLLTHQYEEHDEEVIKGEVDNVLKICRSMAKNLSDEDVEKILDSVSISQGEVFRKIIMLEPMQHALLEMEALKAESSAVIGDLQSSVDTLMSSSAWKAGRAVTALPRWIKRKASRAK